MIIRIQMPLQLNHAVVAKIMLTAGLACSAVIGPCAGAQTRQDEVSRMPGRNASSLSGTTGQRLAPDQVEGIVPTARIANRLQNRVPSRLQTRIDRDYRGPVTGAEQIEGAEGQVRAGGAPR